MAKNFSQIKTAIGDWLDVDLNELSDAIRGDIVNIVMRRACRLHDLSYNEISDTFATIASPLTRDYAIPAQWSRPHTLWYIHPENSNVVFLDYLSKEEFDLNFPDSTKTEHPTAYTVWAGNIQLGKTPKAVLTINRNFYGILADLVTTTNETNRFTVNAWEVLLFLSLVEASEFGIEDQRQPMWAAKAKGMLEELVTEHARARSSGRKSQSKEPG